jgi:acetylglutamate kinase
MDKHETPQIKDTIIQLLSNLANPKEIQKYLDRFTQAGQSHFAVIKVGGAVLENDLENLCSSLAFLERIGLFPIVVHGAGPQLSANLKAKDIPTEFIEGQRVTSAPILKNAKQTFVAQNMTLASRLQTMGVKTASITTGVFDAKPVANTELGYVGEVTSVNVEPIRLAIQSGSIPILSPLADSETGQTLNINADVATNQLAIKIQPYKIIFLTETGGILNKKGKIISAINLATDFDKLMSKKWLHGGMKLKLSQVNDILQQLPDSASVSITKPLHLSKELFTHKGSGTLIRKGERIQSFSDTTSLDQARLTQLIEASFKKTLTPGYLPGLTNANIYITQCYRAAAIIRNFDGIPYLDKFVVANEAKGEGLGKTLWDHIKSQHNALFWRCTPSNPINGFYFSHAAGHYKTKQWNFFWYGIDDFTTVARCFDFALAQPITLTTNNLEESQ